MHSSKVLLWTALASILAPTLTADVAVGDAVCVEGYVMDLYCINNEVLLDRSSVETLRNPELHSVHCLVDVSVCVDSPFEILQDPSDGEEMYLRGWRLDDSSKETVVELARATGRRTAGCTTCGEMGMLDRGFRVGANATVVALGMDGVPPTIEVTSVMAITGEESYCGGDTAPTPVPPGGDEPTSGGHWLLHTGIVNVLFAVAILVSTIFG